MKVVFILLCIFFIPVTSWTKDKLVAGLFNIVPYAYEKNKQVLGITPDIIKNLQKESNIEIETILLPYKRMMHYLQSGRIDFAIFFLSDLSASFSHKLIPLYSLDTIIIGRKNLEIKNYSDLQAMSLATPLGVNYNAGFAQNKKLQIAYVKDYANAIGMLTRGNVDAIIAPKKILIYQLKLMNMNIKQLGKPYVLTTNTAWIQFSNKSKHQQYKKILIDSAQELLNKGVIAEIIQKYYPQ